MSCRVLMMDKPGLKDKAAELLQEERSLILNTRMGDRNAFGVLVERYRGQALRIAVSMVHDMETARDLSQDAFVKAYRSLGMFDLSSPFIPWFYQILRNVCRDYLRRKTRWRNVLGRVSVTREQTGDFMDEMQRDDIARKVRSAVKKLKPDYREIIELKHFAGLNYAEISKILDIPQGTVMSRLYYARKALRSRLEQSLDFLAGESK